MPEMPTFDVAWRQVPPHGHWLVIVRSGECVIWADTTPYIYTLLPPEGGPR